MDRWRHSRSRRSEPCLARDAPAAAHRAGRSVQRPRRYQPRVAGRIAKLQVDVGDSVERGAVIAELESPQLVAERIAARAALSVAKADLDRINSTRPETIAARKAELAASEADVTLNQETFDRKTQLARTGNAPQAMVDEVTRNLESAIRKRESAQAALQLATTGASPEERRLRQLRSSRRRRR